MFEHLDPDRPFAPGPGALEAVAARAARLRRRRRAMRAGGTGSLALVVAVVALLLADPGGDPALEVSQAGDSSDTTAVSLVATTTTGPAPSTTTEAPAAATTTRPAPTTTAARARPTAPPVSATTAAGSLWVAVQVEPGQVEPGGLFRLGVSVRDPDGAVTSFRVQYGDGGGVGFAAGLACPSAGPSDPDPADDVLSYEHAYRRPGRYEVTVEVETTSCTAPAERATVVLPLEVTGSLGPTNGPRRPAAGLALAGPTVDPATDTVAATATGADDDGWVSVVEVEWGDGSPPDVARFGVEQCEDTDKQWPVSRQSVRHHYRPGTYLYRVKVTSVGCDGGHRQEAVSEGRVDVLPASAPRAV